MALKINFTAAIVVDDPVSIFILRPNFPAYEYYARDLRSAIDFIQKEDYHLFTSQIFIRNILFSEFLKQPATKYVHTLMFEPWWK